MPDSEEWMLLCDACGAGWHTFCLKPPLETIPEGTWVCPRCTRSGVTVQQIEARVVRAATPLKPPAWLAKFEGALAMRPARGKRTRSKAASGVVTYAGKKKNIHHFTIEFPDRTTELVTLKELRPLLLDSSGSPPEGHTPAVAATASQPPALTTEEGVKRRLGIVMPGRHSAGKAAKLAHLAQAGSAGLLAASAEECAALGEVLDLSAALSVFAPWGASVQAAAWLREQGCVIRRSSKATGPEAGLAWSCKTLAATAWTWE